MASTTKEADTSSWSKAEKKFENYTSYTISIHCIYHYFCLLRTFPDGFTIFPIFLSSSTPFQPVKIHLSLTATRNTTTP
uniref:Uncharacterized protein n=1 Tax=Talaromyces marneffei PM1 TaxID=1077442 RepID=A0A093VHD3_TALMA